MGCEWLIPFKGRRVSSVYHDNFLWWDGQKTYIMDNHRDALWCWCQHIRKDGKYNLLHIDRHYDMLTVDRSCPWLTHLPDPWTEDRDAFLNSTFPCMECQDNKSLILRYDNYIPLLTARYPHIIDKFVFATHHEGSEPQIQAVDLQVYDLAVINGFSDFTIPNPNTLTWICNIDLDYFFCPDRRDDGKHYVPMLSTPYITRIFTSIREAMDQGRAIVLTIALSPECCGGWRQAESLAYEVCGIMGIPFRLPA